MATKRKAKVDTRVPTLEGILASLMTRAEKNLITNQDYRACYLIISKLMSAATVPVDTRDSFGEKGEAVIAKMKAIKDAVARGESVITAHRNAPQLKKEAVIKVSRENLVEKARIAKRWKERTEGSLDPKLTFDISQDYPESLFADLIAEARNQALPVTPDSLPLCEFCLSPVPHNEATHATKTSIVFVQDLENGELVEKTVSRTLKVVACKEHAINFARTPRGRKSSPYKIKWAVSPEAL